MKTFAKILTGLHFMTVCFNAAWGQSGVNTFLKPSDTLNIGRRNAVIVAESIFYVGGIIQINKPFDRDYLGSKFHFINDNSSSLQMDKAAHIYASYQIGSGFANALQCSGISKKNQLIYGAGMGFVFLTSVEFIDGFSNERGTSYGDIIANSLGPSLYGSQQLLWKEQRIVPKFSFQSDNFFCVTPREMKSRIMDDLDGQTFWLSVNLHSFFKGSKIPKWLNLAIGYGVEGVDSNDRILEKSTNQQLEPYRQLYLSLDVDLTKIKTNSHFLKTVFYVFNTIKIPAPTMEYSTREGLKGHYLFF